LPTEIEENHKETCILNRSAYHPATYAVPWIMLPG